MSLTLMKKLDDYGAIGIKKQINYDKIRFTFKIPDKNKSLQCYRDFTDHNKKLKAGEEVLLPEQMIIYLQMDESVFERYADEEQAKLRKQIEAKKAKAQAEDKSAGVKGLS